MIHSILLLIAALLASSSFANECRNKHEPLVKEFVKAAEKELIAENIKGLKEMVRHSKIVFVHCDGYGKRQEMLNIASEHMNEGNFTKYNVISVKKVDRSHAIARVNIEYVDDKKKLFSATGTLNFKIKQAEKNGCMAVLTKAVFGCLKEKSEKSRKPRNAMFMNYMNQVSA